MRTLAETEGRVLLKLFKDFCQAYIAKDSYFFKHCSLKP